MDSARTRIALPLERDARPSPDWNGIDTPDTLPFRQPEPDPFRDFAFDVNRPGRYRVRVYRPDDVAIAQRSLPRDAIAVAFEDGCLAVISLHA